MPACVNAEALTVVGVEVPEDEAGEIAAGAIVVVCFQLWLRESMGCQCGANQQLLIAVATIEQFEDVPTLVAPKSSFQSNQQRLSIHIYSHAEYAKLKKVNGRLNQESPTLGVW